MILLPLTSNLCAAHYPVMLGDTKVVIVREKHGRGKSFVHLHQNETTALEAARTIIRTEGGQILTLVHPGQRNIAFNLHHKHYQFDPNRIFTEQGIKATLTEGGLYTKAAHRAVKRLANKIKVLLPRGKIIAVHNNETYSMHDYLPGHILENDAQLMHKNDSHYFRNFYFVTQGTDFYRLSALQFNSVLQAPKATDDGSLSIFLAKRDYINVEAGYDQLTAQINMLKHA